MKIRLIYAVILFFLHIFCIANDSDLVHLLNINFLEKINQNKRSAIIYSNENYEDKHGNTYLNDSIGINDFVGHLICCEGRYNSISLGENYFGFDHSKSKYEINLQHRPAILEEYLFISDSNRIIYLNTAAKFYLENKKNMKYTYLVTNLFQMLLYEIREREYKDVDNLIYMIKKLYPELIELDLVFADFALDVLRITKNMDFIKDKYFLSPWFNSDDLLQKYKAIGNFDFEKYMKK
jgi:hypothetical protein